MNLEEKINDLFELRKLPELLALATDDQMLRKRILIRLKRLQQVIYELDKYLESAWYIDETLLNHYWDNIYLALRGFHIRRAQIEAQIGHIKRYQVHELQLREMKLPTRLSMDYFYFYKSCDIKLMRSLIYHSFPKLKYHSSLADWRCFDLLTELHDDVEDLYEDSSAINCNRFMIQLVVEGERQTQQVYHDFINEVNLKCHLRFQGVDRKSLKSKIKKWTDDAGVDLQQLLEAQMINYSKINFEGLLLADYIPELNAKLVTINA